MSKYILPCLALALTLGGCGVTPEAGKAIPAKTFIQDWPREGIRATIEYSTLQLFQPKPVCAGKVSIENYGSKRYSQLYFKVSVFSASKELIATDKFYLIGSLNAGSRAEIELIGNIPSRQLTDARLRQDLTFTFDPTVNPNTPAPSHILSALAKVTIFQMQEGALTALENGDVAGATHRLETMATRLLDMGEHQLARAALLEAGRLARNGNLSPAGRKAINYGTRGLILASPKER